MIHEGALLVTTVSNVDDTFTVATANKYPALWVLDKDFKDSMIVIGGVDMYGKKWKHSQDGALIQAWAPAIAIDDTPAGDMTWANKDWVGISCAGLGRPYLYIQERGTSFTAPQVAGLAAYFYSSYPNLRGEGAARKVKNKIMASSYARTQGGPMCIWNMRTGLLGC